MTATSDHLPEIRHGVSAYEIISMMVGAARKDANLVIAQANAAALGVSFEESELFDYLSEAEQSFRRDMPHTAEVVRDSAGDLFRGIGEHAVYGAAMARQFELDAAA